MNCISRLHGITLSAWAFAGLTGNQLANFIITNTGKFININDNIVNQKGYNNLFAVLTILYLFSLIITHFIFKNKSRN